MIEDQENEMNLELTEIDTLESIVKIPNKILFLGEDNTSLINKILPINANIITRKEKIKKFDVSLSNIYTSYGVSLNKRLFCMNSILVIDDYTINDIYIESVMTKITEFNMLFIMSSMTYNTKYNFDYIFITKNETYDLSNFTSLSTEILQNIMDSIDYTNEILILCSNGEIYVYLTEFQDDIHHYQSNKIQIE